MKLKNFKKYDVVYIKKPFDIQTNYYISQYKADLFNKSNYIEVQIDNTNLFNVKNNKEKTYWCFIPLIGEFKEFNENTECFEKPEII